MKKQSMNYSQVQGENTGTSTDPACAMTSLCPEHCPGNSVLWPTGVSIHFSPARLFNSLATA